MNMTDHINISALQKSNVIVLDDMTTNSSMVSIIIYTVPGPVVLCIHFLALILLIRDRTFRGSQIYLIGALCCTEIVLSIQVMLRGASFYYKNIMLDVATLFGESAGGLMYFTVMTFLTLDRLVEVKLNLKYPIYCTAKKTIIVLFIAFIISFLLFVGLFIYLVDKTPRNNDWYNWHKFFFLSCYSTSRYFSNYCIYNVYLYIQKTPQKDNYPCER